MKERIRTRIFVIILVLNLLLCGLIYMHNLSLKSKLGRYYYNTIEDVMFNLKNAIDYLQGGNLNQADVANYLNNVNKSFTSLYTHSPASIEYWSIIYNHSYYDKICNDSNYRKALLEILNKSYDIIRYTLNDMEKYKQNHIIYKMKNVCYKKFHYKIYYDYFSQKPVNKKKYNNKFEENFYNELNKVIETIDTSDLRTVKIAS